MAGVRTTMRFRPSASDWVVVRTGGPNDTDCVVVELAASGRAGP